MFSFVLSGMLVGDLIYRFVFRINDSLMVIHHLLFYYASFIHMLMGRGGDTVIITG